MPVRMKLPLHLGRARKARGLVVSRVLQIATERRNVLRVASQASENEHQYTKGFHGRMLDEGPLKTISSSPDEGPVNGK